MQGLIQIHLFGDIEEYKKQTYRDIEAIIKTSVGGYACIKGVDVPVSVFSFVSIAIGLFLGLRLIEEE